MKTSRLPHVVLIAGIAATLAGCTFPSSRRVIPRAQANVLQRADTGGVTSVREGTIEGERSNVGLCGGGVMGAAAASGGRGVGGRIGQAAAGVTGAIVGQA